MSPATRRSSQRQREAVAAVAADGDGVAADLPEAVRTHWLHTRRRRALRRARCFRCVWRGECERAPGRSAVGTTDDVRGPACGVSDGTRNKTRCSVPDDPLQRAR